MSKKIGYTFIEISLVFTIFITTTYFTSLSILALEKLNLKNEAINLQSKLRLVQNNALNESNVYGIKFYDEYYEIIRLNKNDNTYEVINLYYFDKVKLYSINSNNNEILYTKRGTTSTPCTVILQSKNFEIKLTVNVGGGRVKIFEIEEI